MRIRSTALQVAVLVIAASAIAVIANGFAAKQRRLMLPGYYPNARVVPARVVSTPPPSITGGLKSAAPQVIATTPTTTTTQAPPPVVITTTRGAAPAAGAEKRVKPAAEAAAAPPTPPKVDVLAKFTPHRDQAYIEIAYDDVAALHAKGVLFLDARRTSVYEEGHIAGARPFSVWEADIDDKLRAFFNERSDPRDQNLPIVIYCSGGACEDSHMLAQKLWEIEFNNVYVYKDGFPDWQKRGGAVHTGANP